MRNAPSAREFVTGWAVQNVCTADLSQTDSLVRRCRDQAARRDIDIASVAEIEDLIRAEIIAYGENAGERYMSRDD